MKVLINFLNKESKRVHTKITTSNIFFTFVVITFLYFLVLFFNLLNAQFIAILAISHSLQNFSSLFLRE